MAIRNSTINNYVDRPLSKGERRMLLRAQRGGMEPRRDKYTQEEKQRMINQRIAEQNQIIAEQKNRVLECGQELNSDKKAIDFSISLLDSANNRDEVFRPREKMSTIFGITPPAPYMCESEECQEQNRKHRRSEIDFQNSRIGKEMQCLTDCIKNKKQNEELDYLLQEGRDIDSGHKARVIQELDTINYAYNSKCGSFKKANKSEAENKNKNLYLILGAIVVLLILKK